MMLGARYPMFDARNWMQESGGKEKEHGIVRPFLLERKGPERSRQGPALTVGDF
jgi:hypothetical protein